MVEIEGSQNFPHETVSAQSVFKTTVPNAPSALIRFLKLAEKEGAYEQLSQKRKQTLQMRFVEGLSMPQIAERLEISKQAVSQALMLTPESLYKKMLKDVNSYRTNISFTEILAAYSAYRLESDVRKK